MNYRISLIALLCLINLTLPCFAKEWRNIFPLKTTRTEVLKLLGEPQKSEAVEGEYFKIDDGIVKIRWQRADCYGTDESIETVSTKSDFLVYQITFIPKEPLTSASIEPEKISEPKNDPQDLGEVKTEIKPDYKKWLSQDVHCFGSNCTILGQDNGFGYSTSDKGVTALYYYPTGKEQVAWKEKLQPCLSEQH